MSATVKQETPGAFVDPYNFFCLRKDLLEQAEAHKVAMAKGAELPEDLRALYMGVQGAFAASLEKAIQMLDEAAFKSKADSMPKRPNPGKYGFRV